MIGKIVKKNGVSWAILSMQDQAGMALELKHKSDLKGIEFGTRFNLVEENEDLEVMGHLNDREIEIGLRDLTVILAKKHRHHVDSSQKAKEKLANSVKIPPSGKVIDEHEIANMVHASLDGWLTAGRFAGKFERDLAMKMQATKLIAVNSGSSANLIALSTLTSPKLGARALKPGDEVITAAAGFPTTINPIIQNQLMPVLVDSNLSDGNINVDQVEAAIGPKTKAIMAAHTLGNPMDIERLARLAKKHGLFLIEDCCDALGSTVNGKLCGTFGDLSTLSFYPAHHMTMGEGGAVFGKDIELMKIAESFRDWGRDCYCDPGRDNTCGDRFCKQMGDLPYGYDHKYTYSHVGYNLKITDMQAACGLAQLSKVDHFIALRKHNHRSLKTKLVSRGADRYLTFQEPLFNSDPSWFGFLMTLKEDAPVSRHEMVQHLEKNGIGTRLLFAGNIIRQPYFKGQSARIPFELTVADILMNRAFWMGIWPGVTESQLDYIADTLMNLIEC